MALRRALEIELEYLKTSRHAQSALEQYAGPPVEYAV